MRHHDLGEFIRKALLHAGCDPKLIKDLDNHATIQIELTDGPAIYVGTVQEFVVIWSDLCDYHENIVDHCARPLLREIMAGFSYSRANQLVLRETDGKLQIYADIADQYLEEAEAMANAINGFYEGQERILEIIRQ